VLGWLFLSLRTVQKWPSHSRVPVIAKGIVIKHFKWQTQPYANNTPFMGNS
jgi:hypothetical protein